MSLLSFYQQKTLKNYQSFFPKNLKDLYIGMNITQETNVKMRHKGVYTFP